MEWETKVEMIQFFNKQEDEKALDILIENIDNVDEQGWEMFFTALVLTKENINQYKEKHKIISDKVKELNLKSDSFRTAIRMAFYDELTLNI